MIANPPVPAVPKEFKRLSNKGIPPNNNKTVSTNVKIAYIIYKILAVKRILETSLPTTGPGTSAFKICNERPDEIGINAITKTKIPIPPSQ